MLSVISIRSIKPHFWYGKEEGKSINMIYFAISNPSYPILFPAIPQNQLSSRVRGTYHLEEGERRLSPHTETKLLVLIFWRISQNAHQCKHNLAIPLSLLALQFPANIVVHWKRIPLRPRWWSWYSALVPKVLPFFWQSGPWWLSLPLVTLERTTQEFQIQCEHILWKECLG